MSQVLEQAGQGECMVAACSAATKCRCSMSSRCRTSSLGNLRLCDNRLSGFCTLPALESARSQRKVPQVQRTGSSTGGTPFRCLRSPVCRFRVNLVRCLPVCASLASNLSSPPLPLPRLYSPLRRPQSDNGHAEPVQMRNVNRSQSARSRPSDHTPCVPPLLASGV